MLKLKTQLDIVKYSLYVKKICARGRAGGVGPPSVDLNNFIHQTSGRNSKQ